LPEEEFLFVQTAILDTLSEYEYDDVYGWGYLFDCEEVNRLPTIDLLFGGYWMEMQVDDYVLPFQSGVCALCMSAMDINFAVLGSSFMRDFYSVHDMTNGKFGFAPLVGALIPKNPAVLG
jgi:hypothetical protein